MSKIYGYARCSTNEDKQDINRQKKELKVLGATDETIYFEYASGRKDDRVEFAKLMNVVREGDTICTTEVSRLTRSTKMLCDIIEQIQEKKLRLIIQGGPTIDCREGKIDVMTEGMLKMWGVFAEIEAKLISERVKSGMKNAKENGVHLGRSATTFEDIPPIFHKYYERYKREKESNQKDAMTIVELARLCGMARNTIYKYIKLVEVQAK